MQANTIGALNTAVGTQALLENIAGFNNTAIGNAAMFVAQCSNDVAVGEAALAQDTFGNNVAVGNGAMNFSVTATNNTAVGNNTLVNAQGVSNIAVGNNAGSALNSTESDNIYIGNVGVSGDNGIIRIGTGVTHVAAYIQGVFGATVGAGGLPVEVDSSGQLGTVVSSKRLKKNIADMATDSELIYDLRPVSFSYISDEESTKQYGLIAEEVAEIFPSLVVYDCDEQPLSVRYQVLPILLLNEVQKQHEVIAQQGKTIWQQGEDFACAIEKIEQQDKIIDNIQNRLLALEQH